MGHYQKIDVILNDIKELHEMVTGFREESNVPRFIFKLAENKAQKIKTELAAIADDFNTEDVKEGESLNKEVEQEQVFVPEEVSTAKEDLPVDVAPLGKEELVQEKLEDEVVVEPKKEFVRSKDPALMTKTESLSEQFAEKMESLNDTIEKKLIVDVRKALSLNDRFRFQRELFNNDAHLMNKTLDEIGSFSSLTEVLAYLKDTFNWDKDNPHAVDFTKIVIKKFS